MPIPRNINKEHVLEAIRKINKKGVRDKRESTRYSLVYEGESYPPKYVVSIANIFANGEEYSPTLFSGGIETNRFLSKLGFTITENKESEIEILNKNVSINIPKLEPSKRAREYNKYSNKDKDSIVYEYLFNAMSHRSLDENILGILPDRRTGHESMNILHFIGLKDKHKGIFRDYSIKEAMDIMKQQDSDFELVIHSLFRLNNQLEKIQDLEVIILDDIDSEKAEEDNYYKDGAIKEYYGKRYERKPENRKKAIEIHGLSCVVCEFNFEEGYGERGKDYIEVHHVKPLSSIGKEVSINPKEDLVPVCSNCHRMIHRKKEEVLTVNELRDLIDNIKIKLQ
jgi:5-methylcytosine-specific restriction enzyme A